MPMVRGLIPLSTRQNIQSLLPTSTTQSIAVMSRCMKNTSPSGLKLALGVVGDVFFDAATDNRQ
jgi:hypothetical protein